MVAWEIPYSAVRVKSASRAQNEARKPIEQHDLIRRSDATKHLYDVIINDPRFYDWQLDVVVGALYDVPRVTEAEIND